MEVDTGASVSVISREALSTSCGVQKLHLNLKKLRYV